MSVYNSQKDRINYACKVIINGGPCSRSFDTCFEMNDSDEVTHAILRRSLKNPRLLQGLQSNKTLRFDYIKELDRERYGAKAIYLD